MNTSARSPARLAFWTLVALSALVSLVLLIATLVLPGWAAGRGVAMASEALGRPVRIERAQFQPWRLALVVDGLRVDGLAADRPPLFTLAKLDAALSLRSLLRGHLVVESLALTRPELRLARVAPGHYDIDDLIQRFAPKADAAGGEDAEFAVYNIELTDGRLLFDDRPVQRKHELSALRLALPYVSTLAADVKVQVQPHLSGKLDGVAFDSRAEALPFADDASARLSFKTAGLDLAPLAAYLPASAPVRLGAGLLDVDLALDFAERPGQPPAVKLSGQLQLSDLALTLPDGQALLGWKRLSLPLVELQPLRRQVALGQVVLQGPTGWLRPLPAVQGRAPASAAPATPPWQASVAGLEISDGRFTAGAVGLQTIQLKLGAAAWPLKAPVKADASLRLDDATLSAQATLSPEALEAEATLQDLAVQPLAAWLPLPRGSTLAAGVSTRARLTLPKPLDPGAVDRVHLTLSELQVSDARLALAGQVLASVASARLDEADIDPGARRVRLGQLQLDTPRAQLARQADGRLNIAPLLPAGEAPAAAGPAWQLRLAGLAVERGALRWRDAAVPDGVAPVALAIEPLRLQLGTLSWPSSAPVQAQLEARIGALGEGGQPQAAGAGSLQWSGRVALAPLQANGRLQGRGVPLHLLNAYLDPAWGLHLQRAELGLATDIQARQQAGGDWQVGGSGDVRVGPLALAQTRVLDGRRIVGEDLLSWQALQLDGVKLALAPDAPLRLAVREAVLDEAYARLIVSEQGRFNLRDLRPTPAGAITPPTPAEAAASAAPVASAASDVALAASAAASAAVAAVTPAPEIAVERIRVNRGTVDFNDRFVRPNYSARLTELQGSLGAFSTTAPQMAPLTLRGKVAGTGLLDIDGQLRPGTPLVLDIAANATDIELVPLSPYAAKYVGYAIERGKLSTKLRYTVEPGGQLVASNQIILNQLTFGERVESPDATTLPVRFAVALLKDGNGVIDVNLPVSGSINDPHFSVGGLVLKLILNLIGKAITAPFALFSGSDAHQEPEVSFAPGSGELIATDRLDRIARLLADKPGVLLTLTGWADPMAERQVLREQRLAQALAGVQAASPEAALKRLYDGSKLPNKPRNALGLAKELPPEQMRGLLLASYAVEDEVLTQLAMARAVAVRDALLARGAPNARLFVAAPKLCDDACASGWRPHVELSLSAQ